MIEKKNNMMQNMKTGAMKKKIQSKKEKEEGTREIKKRSERNVSLAKSVPENNRSGWTGKNGQQVNGHWNSILRQE